MDCSTIVDRRETLEVATLFVEYDLMEPVVPDRAFISQNPTCNLFQPTKYAIYQLTQRGKDVVSGNGSRKRASESESGTGSHRNWCRPKFQHAEARRRPDQPALRLLFRENLRETHCEENLSFYVDVDEFVRGCKAAIRIAQKNPSGTSTDGIKEIMTQAYGIYNSFLAPGLAARAQHRSPIAQQLGNPDDKSARQNVAMVDTLQEVTSLFEDAQNAVFKLMASVSFPARTFFAVAEYATNDCL